MSILDGKPNVVIGADASDIVRKFNPYHGKGGLFASRSGGGGASGGGGGKSAAADLKPGMKVDLGKDSMFKLGHERNVERNMWQGAAGNTHVYGQHTVTKVSTSNGRTSLGLRDSSGNDHNITVSASAKIKLAGTSKPGPIAAAEASLGRMNISPNMMSGGGVS